MLKRHHPDCHGFGFRAKAAKDSTCRPSHLLRRKLKHNIGTSKHSTLSLDLVFDLSPCLLNRRQTAILKPTHLIAHVHSLASIHDSKLFTAGQVGMLLTCHKPGPHETYKQRQALRRKTNTHVSPASSALPKAAMSCKMWGPALRCGILRCTARPATENNPVLGRHPCYFHLDRPLGMLC